LREGHFVVKHFIDINNERCRKHPVLSLLLFSLRRLIKELRERHYCND